MNEKCDVCSRPYRWEVHWRDGEVSFLCDRDAPSIADQAAELIRDGKDDWVTEADT